MKVVIHYLKLTILNKVETQHLFSINLRIQIFFFFELYVMINVNKNGVNSENFCAFFTTDKFTYNAS